MLPKPFTKDGLLGMLEKHLKHLKTIKEMAGLAPGQAGDSELVDRQLHTPWLSDESTLHTRTPQPDLHVPLPAAAKADYQLGESEYLQMIATLMQTPPATITPEDKSDRPHDPNGPSSSSSSIPTHSRDPPSPRQKRKRL